jgi:hypothetical protein
VVSEFFAFEESLTEILTKRYKIPGQIPSMTTVFLHARILRQGQFEPSIEIMIKILTDAGQESEVLSLTFDKPEIPLTFSSALLGGLLYIYYRILREIYHS